MRHFSSSPSPNAAPPGGDLTQRIPWTPPANPRLQVTSGGAAKRDTRLLKHVFVGAVSVSLLIALLFRWQPLPAAYAAAPKVMPPTLPPVSPPAARYPAETGMAPNLLIVTTQSVESPALYTASRLAEPPGGSAQVVPPAVPMPPDSEAIRMVR